MKTEAQKAAKSIFMKEYYQRNKNKIKSNQKLKDDVKKNEFSSKTAEQKEAIRVKQRASSTKYYAKQKIIREAIISV